MARAAAREGPSVNTTEFFFPGTLTYFVLFALALAFLVVILEEDLLLCFRR